MFFFETRCTQPLITLMAIQRLADRTQQVELDVSYGRIQRLYHGYI